jgi:hypothetical protein
MIANKLRVDASGRWLLPFWREMGGQPSCNTRPSLHGMPGLLVSTDKVRSRGPQNAADKHLQTGQAGMHAAMHRDGRMAHTHVL